MCELSKKKIELSNYIWLLHYFVGWYTNSESFLSKRNGQLTSSSRSRRAETKLSSPNFSLSIDATKILFTPILEYISFLIG